MIDSLATEIHAENVAAGWWDEFPYKPDRTKTAIMLVVTELAEAAEGVRKDLMDDKLPQHKMLHVELADAAIRLLDLAGGLDVTIEHTDGQFAYEVKKQAARQARMRNDLERLYKCVDAVMAYSSSVISIREGLTEVFAMARLHDVNLFKIIAEKRAFNRHRADHKRENRAKPGGKKY
jgi:NTP pyrophosphatase (non-canonical NTP hydrolase)